MKAILCGYNWVGCKALDLLLERDYEVFVYTHENPPYINSLIELCEKRKIPYTTDKITIQNIPFKPNVIASIYYRYIISDDIINLVNGKIFNLHPSLLPDYKGCSSLTWAIIDGKRNTGFTYHYLTSEIDGGNIILQRSINIEDWDTQVTLYHRVMFVASEYFLDTLEKVLKGYQGKKQIGLGNYNKRGCPYYGKIDKKWSIDKIERFIRAMNYPPLPYATLENQEIRTFTEFLKKTKPKDENPI